MDLEKLCKGLSKDSRLPLASTQCFDQTDWSNGPSRLGLTSTIDPLLLLQRLRPICWADFGMWKAFKLQLVIRFSQFSCKESFCKQKRQLRGQFLC